MRPQTYESAEEAKILSYVFAGRSGLENTSFALLDPKGKKLTRGSRSPSMTYGTAARFVEALNETAEAYAAKAKPIAALPALADLRLALNVAAADMRPLVIVRGADAESAAKLAVAVAALAWGDALIGRCHYVVLAAEETFEELTPMLGVTVVQPDPFGLGGKVLAHSPAGAAATALKASVLAGVAAHKVEAREHDDHIREARRKGIRWESLLEVTDTQAARKRR
ncbi:MAG: hypothetical protein R3F49_03420 [Planctomycetota bacterium]